MKTDKQPHTVGRAVNTVTLWLVVGLVLAGLCAPTGVQASVGGPAGPEAPATSHEPSFPLQIPQMAAPIGFAEMDTAAELQAAVTMEMIPNTGTADRTSVYNGDTVTYTLVLTNESAVPITYFTLYDLLPQDTLDNITCVSTAPVCELIVEQEVFPEPSGGTVVVTATRQIKWEVLTPLAPQERFTVAFSGRLMGQPEGARFTNRAFVRYWLQGATQPGTASVELSLTAHVRITPGTTSISTVPTWFSNDMGGTLSQDWGDFDRDGDLDLALGSSLGTAIYRNDGGVLQQIMDFMPDAQGQQRLSYGVRWADLIPEADHTLELVVVGDSADHTANSEGINYIYQFDSAQQSFSTSEVFTTDLQLVRIAPGDYDGDGDIDLVASTNAINAPCTVALYRNNGTGHFTGTVTAAGPNQIECLSQAATAALGPGDYDNDGDLDLALGAFPSTLHLLVNERNGAVFTATNPLVTLKTIESGLEYIPYDLVWGDYNGDGYLDLAAAYPLQREAQVYQNQPSSGTLIATAESIRTSTFMTPLTVDWGDFNGDGRLDLAVADSRLKFYEYSSSTQAFSLISSLVPPLTTGQVWSIQGVELNEQHTLNLAMTNRDGPSRIFSIVGPKLRLTSVPLGSGTFGQVLGSSVAWGDVDNDGDLDLLVGADALGVSSYLYLNQQGRFNTRVEIRSSGFGPHAVAWGDVTGDGRLDMAIGTPSEVHIYFNGNTVGEPNQRFRMGHPAASVAWGDADDDGRLDLLVGQNGGPVTLYLNRGTQLSTTAIFTTSEIGQITSVAWGDYDQDYYMDFAVGAADQPLRVYRNNGDGRTFRLAWSSPAVVPALSLDGADYDRDGDLDLAVAGSGQVMVWENQGTTFGTAPVWQATLAASSVAWGDWDSDGYPDLAAGGTFSPTSVVYANLGSAPGVPQLAELWYGSSNLPVAGLAWGDMEGDGDLDLAVASAGGVGRTSAMADEAGLLPQSYAVRQTTAALALEPSGVYTNILATPAHLYYPANSLTPLANTPPYVRVARPGTTGAAYFYSAAPVLTGPNHPTVTIQYQVYDHEADPLARTYFEYSLDGGSVWKTATAVTSTVILTQTATTGATGTFIWNAAADRAIGDNARFRVRVVPNNAVGPVQRAVGIGVSPPFRVRSVDCVWPSGASIVFTPTTVVTAGQQIEFTGRVLLAEGFITYEWDFGDGTTGSGRVIKHSYGQGGTYTVTLAVHGPDCPPSIPSRPAYAFTVVTIPRGGRLYLPLVLRNRSTTLVAQSELPETFPPVTLAAPPATTPVAVRFSVPQLQATTASAGSNLLRITTSAQGFSHQPAVNRDGSRLAFWSTARTARNLDGSIEIFLADVQPNGTLSYTQLTSSTGSILVGFNLGPSMDEAGDRVVFFSDRDLTGQNPDRNFEIFLADIGAGGIFTLTQLTITPKGVNILPEISGNGRFVVFASDRDLTGDGQVDGQTEIYRAELLAGGGTTFTRITTAPANHPGSSDEPTISADGKRIAFTSEQDLTGENADGNGEIFLAEVLPGGAITYTQITHSDLGVNEQPSLSGDGRWLAFISDRDLVAGQNTAHIRQVFMAELGTDPHSVSLSQLTTSSGAKSRPTISADGLRLAYLLNQQVQLYDAVEQTTLSGGTGADNAYPSLSAGGDAVAFADSGQIYLRRYPLADLAVTKSGMPTTVAVGGLVTYTLVVTNYGPSPATDVLLSDTLPAGFVSSLTGGSPEGYTDKDGTPNGFGGGVHSGTYWSTVKQMVQLTPVVSSALVLLHLDESAGATTFNDASGAGNPAACTGTTCPQVVTGQFGNALQLDGSNDHLIINSAPRLANRSFTVAFWSRRLSTGTPDVVVGQGVPTTNSGFYIGFRDNNRFTCAFWGNDLDTSASYDTLWHHWACTYDVATRRRTLYRDGVLVAQDTATAHYQGSGPLVVGNFPGLMHYFHGQLDEVAIFTRVLTATEVQLLMGTPVMPYSGYFDSRVLTDTLGSGRWSTLGWTPYRPLGESLPDEGIQETGYVTGNVNMNGTVLLLHLDESSGANAFQDTSGRSNNTYCLGTTCPTAGTPGAFATALEFDGAVDYLYAPDNSTLDLNQFTVGLWVWPVTVTPGLYQTLLVKEDSYGYNVNYSLMLAKGSTQVNYDFLPAGQCGNIDAFVGGNGTQALQLNAWNHVMMTYDGTNLVGYVNGQQDVIFPGVPAPCQNSFPLKLGREFSDNVQTPFKGRLDEIVILNRPLSADEVRDHYLRGLARLRFQVRACPTPACTGVAFVGPDGTFRSFYTSLDDALVGPPELGLQNLAAGRYAQYRFALDADARPWEFGVSRVTLRPSVTCQGQETVTCTLGSAAAPLAVGQAFSLTLPAQIVDGYAAYLAAAEVGGQRVVTNTVAVDAEESDHGPAGNNTGLAHTGLDFSILMGITISGRDVAAVDTPAAFTATVNPLNATPPISYTWSATGKPTAVYTSGQVSYVLTYTWSTPGVRVITVTADNPFHTVVTDVHTVTVVYKVDGLRLTASSPVELEEFTVLTATVAPTSTDVTYLWDFGDGQTATSGPGTTTILTHTYAQTGTYTVVVTATNLYNRLVQTATVEVLEAPIRNLQLQSNSPVPLGTNAAVTATLTTGTNITYTWDFGDGTPPVEVTPYYLAKTVPLTHTYVQTGTYTVVVTATNSVGSEVVTTSVQVVDAPIQGLVVLHNSPTEYDDPTVLTATVAAGTNIHYNWAFGDGEFTTTQMLTLTNQVSLTHVFSTYVPLRLYTVVVTATNGTNSVTATTVVTIYRTCWAQLNGADYATVQAAIEAAASGATVKVAGTCSRLNTSGGQSQVAYLDRSLTLQGGYTYTQWTVADPIANPTTLDARGQGRGLFITGGNVVTVSGLRFTGGSADYGGGLYALNATLTLSACQFFGNQATVYGGGLWLEGGTGTLRYSQVTSNTAGEGGGLYIKSNPATVDSLIIRGNSAGTQGGGLYLFASNATVINTVLADNQAPTQGSGVSIYSGSPRFLHTTLARNSGNNSFYYNSAGSQVYLTNTILVSHTTGVVVNAGSALLNGVLWAGNGTNTSGAVTVTNAVTGPPAFLADGYHIGLDSAARNRGLAAGVAVDLEGDRRDRTPDLGADELRTCWVRLNNSPTDYADVQAAVDAATQPTDEVKVAGLCASLEVRAGVTQTVYLSRTLLLRGGYTLTNWTTPDPVAHPTTLDALGGGRALYITGAISPTISGLHLVNGYARQGGGAYVLTATPVFSQTWLEGNGATVAGGGLFLNGGGLTLTATTVFANQAAHGGGLYLQTAQPPAALSGAVFRLPLDEPVGATTFVDAVGGDNPAVCSGATCPLAEEWGAFGSGLHFNGAQSITIADAPALRVSQFSLSLWFYWDDLNTANSQCLINKRDQHFALFTGGNAGVNGLRFIPAGTTVLEVPNVILPGWNHLVATYDGSNAHLYRNGVLVGSLTGIVGDDLTADSYPFLLGRREGDTYYFHGALDEVHFYNRALSAAEVAALAAPALTSGAIRLSGSTLLSNTASGNGGGLYLRLGWQTLLTGNQVLSNSAALGGGFFLDTPGLPGSLLHLPLDEPARTDTWAELSGRGYHATCSGTACPQPARSGPVRYAAAFEGDDSLVSAALPLSNTSFTLAAWARRGSVGREDFFIGQGNTVANQGLHLGFRGGSDNRFTCGFYANDLNSPAAETDLQWHHWVCTYDALTNQRQLYKDGQPVSSDTSPADYQGSGPLWIGRSSWSSSGFQGLLDEVQIYGRALSTAEVQRLYRLTQPPAVQLEGTTLAANHAITGGGLAVRGGAAAIVGNLLRENSAALVNGGYGGGFWLEHSGALLEANTLTANQSHRGGGGALLNSPAILRSNWVLTNTALQDGGGLHFRDSVASLLGNRVLGNRAAGPGSGWGGGLYLYQSHAQLKNNVLMNNVAAVTGGGAFVDSSAAQFWHTTLVSNTNTGIWMQDAAVPLALTNTLVVSHVTGVRGGSPAGMTMDGVLWFGNTLDASGAVGVNHATTGAPAFAADGYHITHDSAARDAGIIGLNYDLDGDPRPVGAGYDLGADEIRTCFAKLNDAPTIYEEIQLAIDASTRVTDVVKLSGYCRGVSVRDGLTQTVYLSKTLTLQGGWNLDFTLRDPALYPTTLDADGNRRVVYITGNITPTLLDLRLTGGNATGLGGDPGGADSGGGIYVVTATATISGCHVYDNQAVYGGGIFLLRSNARLIGNTVTANHADRFGGGIEIDYGDLAQLSRNTVVSNSVGSTLCDTQFCGGGGIYVYVTAPITLTDTIIVSNTTQVEGGGLYLDTSVVSVRNTVLRNNSADIGGGLTVYSTTAWMTNTLIADNQATNYAGGVEATASTLTMRHTTLARNAGGDGSGFYVADDLGRYSLVTLTNTILVSQTVGLTVTAGNAATLQGVLWFGNGTNSGGGGTINVTQAITGAPAFVDPTAGDYRLQGFSMARDAGVAGPADTDLDGNPRPQGKAPDLGTYEFQAALTLAKRQNPTAVQAGGLLTYTLTYTATGTRPALGVLLSDTTPAHTTFVTAIPTPASAPGVGASGPVVWLLGDLTPLATGAVTLVVQVNRPLTRGLVLTNSALLTDTQGLADTAALTNAVQTSHALTLTQWASASPAPAGEPLTYTLAYTITGNEPVLGAVMSNPLPAHTTFVTATGGLGLLGTDPVRWALGDVLLPESGQTQTTGMLTLVVQVGPAPNGTWLTNTAILSDTSGQSATRTITTPIQSAHTLSVTKSASSAVVQAGDPLTYTIAYTVTGTEPALNPRLADTLPAQVTLVSCTGAPCGAVGRTVTWTVGTLTPTATGLVTAVVQVPSLLNGTVLTNAVTFTDTLGGNATHSITTLVQSSHSLSVTKLGPLTCTPGTLITYTLLYTVTGNEPARGLILSDTLPANTTYVGCSGGLSCSRSGTLVTWTLGTLTPTLAAPASGTARLTVTVVSPLDNGTRITNSVALTDTTGLSATDTITGEVISQPLLQLLKTSLNAGGPPLIPGERLTYTLRITNTGTARADVTITDTVPTFTDYVVGSISGGDSRSVNLPVLNWTLNNLGSGAAAQLSFAVVVTTPLTHATAIYNLVTATGVNGTGSHQVSVAAQDDLTDTVTAGHTLTLTKSATPSMAQPGALLTYTIAYTVTGTEPVYDVVVSDTTPVSTTYFSATPAPTSAPGVGSSGTVRWQRGNLLPPASGQTQATGVLTWVVQVANLPPAGVPLTNTVIITDASGQSATRVITTPLQGSHTLTVTKRSAPALVYPGDLVTYTLVYTVTGNESAPGVVVSDTVPANTTYQSCAGGLTCSGPAVGSGGLVTWDLGNVAPGSGAVTLTVQVIASPPAGVALTNTVFISDTSGLSGTYRLTTTLQSRHTLRLAKQGPALVGAGNLLTYTLAYSVTGNENASSARISDTVPLNTLYESCAGGTSCAQVSGLVTWSLGTLTPSSAGVVTLTVRAATPLISGTQILNTAFISDTNAGITAAAQATTLVTATHSLALTKQGAATVNAGDWLTYTLLYTVTGNEPAPGAVISDTVPANTLYQSCAPAGCTESGGVVRWNLGTLNPASGRVTLTVQTTVPLANGTVLTNVGAFTDTGGLSSGGSQVTTTVSSSHTLVVRKVVAPATVQPGGTLTYTITYTVTGTELAPGVTLSDTLPLSTTDPLCTPACTITGNGVMTTVTWSLGTLTPVASGLVTLTVLVDTAVPSGTTLANTVSITDTTGAAGSDTVNTLVQTGSTRARRILGLELPPPRYGVVERQRWGRARC